ncbi:nucleoside-diphosphate-sugar pyrophosphorylase [Nitrospira sp.]|nr:nucleoside-diphosphate-sugar pyrophosphorylase [Nitrospira sp.]
MKAMILAAGLGTRLRPLTNTMPKPLLPVGGTPLILWNLLLLRRHKFRDVVINLHHLGPMIEHALGDGHRFGLRITYSREPVVLGTGGALKQVESQFSGQPMLVMNGDTLIEIDLEELADLHLSRKPVATMVLREDPEAGRWGLVEIDEAHRIQRINGNGRINPSGHVPRMFAGVHILHPRLLRRLPPAGKPSNIIDAYVQALHDEETLLGYDAQGYWSDVGTPERYAQAERDVLDGRLRLADRQQPAGSEPASIPQDRRVAS